MDNFSSLMIGFENCETMTFEAEEVASFSINSITKDLYNDWYNNRVHETQKSSDMILALLPDANKQYSDKEKTFKRIQRIYNITDITIIKDDYSTENVFVKWCRDNDKINKFQTVDNLSDGTLIIVVSEKRTAEEIKEKLNKKIEKIDAENDTLKQSIDKTHGRWIKISGLVTAGGDPVYRCSNCGLDEHVYGIEHSDKHVVCRNCGIINIYPWEMKKK